MPSTSSKLKAFAVMAFAGVISSVSIQAAGTASVQFYSLVADTGSGLILQSKSGTTSVSSLFLGSTGSDWDPLGKNIGGSWGARITGCIQVPSNGSYSFQVTSAESAYVYIDNVLVVDNGKNSPGHGGFFKTPGDSPTGTPTYPSANTGSASLTAGFHTIRVDYLNVLGNLDSGYNFVQTSYLVGGNYEELPLVDCPAVPEAGSMYAAGLLATAAFFRIRSKKAQAAS